MNAESLRGRISFDGTATPTKTALFLVVCAAWLLPGLLGHDPWKADEAVAFGSVVEMLRHGDWIVFRVAGEPYLEKAPLFLWVAAILAKLLGAAFPLHDAARLASGAFMTATLALTCLTARELIGARAMRLAVFLLIGCLGLLIRAHEMTPDLAGLTGVALALYGLALAMRRPVAGGVATGLGIGCAFLGNGFLPLGMVFALITLLPLGGAEWRGRRYATTVGVALLCSAPLLAVWPVALAMRSPELVRMWLSAPGTLRWTNPFAGDGLGLVYFTKLLTWYAWPAWPLAAWTVWRAWKRIEVRSDLLLPLLAFVAFFVVLGFFSESRDANALPLLLPLAILGVADLESLPRGGASALDWFGMTTFFLFAAVVWVLWFAAITGEPVAASAWLQREVPGLDYRFQFPAVVFATLLTLMWIVVVARSLRSNRRALVNWTTGITMVWMLVMTLGLPAVDHARSYRSVAQKLGRAIPANTQCIARRNVGDAQRALLDYFIGLQTVRDDSTMASQCSVLLTQGTPLRVPDAGPQWSEIWRGARPGDRTELFVLYERK